MNTGFDTNGGKKLEFHGGTLGAFIPLIVLGISILALFVNGFTATNSFWVAGFAALCVAFLLIKDKSEFTLVSAETERFLIEKGFFDVSVRENQGDFQVKGMDLNLRDIYLMLDVSSKDMEEIFLDAR